MRLYKDCQHAGHAATHQSVHDDFGGTICSRHEQVLGIAAVKEQAGDRDNESAGDNVGLVVRPEFFTLTDKPFFKGQVVVFIDMVDNFLKL